jgi:hypothetical protein
VLVPVRDPAPNQQTRRIIFQDLAMSFKRSCLIPLKLLPELSMPVPGALGALESPEAAFAGFHVEAV